MPDKLVFVKELKSGVTKGENPKQYPIIIDQDNEQWFIWTNTKLELNKAYLITFHENERQFKDIDAIKPVVNVFHQKALAETANRNDYIRNYSIPLGYAKDLAVAGKIEPTIKAMSEIAQDMYDWVQSRSDAEMARINPDKETK